MAGVFSDQASPLRWLSGRLTKPLVFFISLSGLSLVPLALIKSGTGLPEDNGYQNKREILATGWKISPDTYNPFKVVENPIDIDIRSESHARFRVTDPSHIYQVADSTLRPHLVHLKSNTHSRKDREMIGLTVELLESLGTLQQLVSGHFIDSGQWPGKLPETAIKAHRMVEKMAFGDRGEIRVDLGVNFGENRRIRLIPSFNSDNASMSWFCQTNIPNRWLGQGSGRACIYHPLLKFNSSAQHPR